MDPAAAEVYRRNDARLNEERIRMVAEGTLPDSKIELIRLAQQHLRWHNQNTPNEFNDPTLTAILQKLVDLSKAPA